MYIVLDILLYRKCYIYILCIGCTCTCPKRATYAVMCGFVVESRAWSDALDEGVAW